MCNLYKKYKPCKINDMYVNDETKNLLNVFIDIDSLNLLIIGDSGTGKTTLIDVLIYEYYKTQSKQILAENVMYVNILKEQSIHSFRQNIKTFCQTTNNINQKKTIVIDNIDQINEQTQQIIRNNIDKYNHKVNFLLSCSTVQKVLDNLQSRVNIIKLHNFTKSNLVDLSNKIIQNENIVIDKKSIEYLINISNNSIRLLLSHITKIILLNSSTSLEKIKSICTQISYSFFDEYTHLWLEKKNFEKSANKITALIDMGYSVMDILETYFNYIKNVSMLNDTHKFAIFPILTKYINIFHSIHENSFELTLFNYELMQTFKNIDQ